MNYVKYDSDVLNSFGSKAGSGSNKLFLGVLR